MQADKIISYVLKMVLDEYLVTARNSYVYIQDDEIKPEMKKYFTSVLKKLENDYKVLRLRIAPHTEIEESRYAKYTSYEIKVLDSFLELCEQKGLYNIVTPIVYDGEHGLISIYGARPVPLFKSGSIPSKLFDQVVQKDGARINADFIVNDYSDITNPDKEIDVKALRNARDRLNEKLEQISELREVVCYQKNEFWLNLKYVSPTSPYKSQ